MLKSWAKVLLVLYACCMGGSQGSVPQLQLRDSLPSPIAHVQEEAVGQGLQGLAKAWEMLSSSQGHSCGDV